MTESGKLRIAALVSGSGTNLQAFIDNSRDGSLMADVAVVVSDRADAYGLTRAAEAHIPHHVVSYREAVKRSSEMSEPKRGTDIEALDRRQRILAILDRAARIKRLRALVEAEQELIDVLRSYRVDLVCLAGYMRLLSPYFLDHFNQDGRLRVLNIHPALLPAFPGQHGYQDTFTYGCKWGGVTVHFVDEGEDSGPVVAQAVYPIWPQDDLKAVQARGLALEYQVYTQCINWVAAGQVRLTGNIGSRTAVTITDPEYPSIVRSWVESACR